MVVDHTAVISDLAAVQSVVHDADAQEQRAGHQPVGNHLHHATRDAHGNAGQSTAFADNSPGEEKTQRDKTHVRDRRIRDQLFHVLLDQRHEPDVYDRKQRQDNHHEREGSRGIRSNWQAEAHKSVPAHLQQYRGQDHRASGGRFHVSIRQPRVHRPHRHLHGKCDQESQEDPVCSFIDSGKAWKSRML